MWDVTWMLSGILPNYLYYFFIVIRLPFCLSHTLFSYPLHIKITADLLFLIVLDISQVLSGDPLLRFLFLDCHYFHIFMVFIF